MVVIIRLPNRLPNGVRRTTFQQPHCLGQLPLMQHHQPMQMIRHHYITKRLRPAFSLQRHELLNQLASIVERCKIRCPVLCHRRNVVRHAGLRNTAFAQIVISHHPPRRSGFNPTNYHPVGINPDLRLPTEDRALKQGRIVVAHSVSIVAITAAFWQLKRLPHGIGCRSVFRPTCRAKARPTEKPGRPEQRHVGQTPTPLSSPAPSRSWLNWPLCANR